MARTVARLVAGMLLLAARPPPSSAVEPSASAPARPEEAEVLVPAHAESGGWGAPVFQLSTVRGETAMFTCGRGGWLIARRFTLGGGGCGLVSGIAAPPEVQPAGGGAELSLGYGGLWLEYVVRPLRVVHVTFGTLLGGGSVNVDEDTAHHEDGFFVLEPTAAIELNVARFMRADVGAAYRWVVGASMPGLSDSDVSAFSLVAVLKFGKF